jgi:hypothetical protein
MKKGQPAGWPFLLPDDSELLLRLFLLGFHAGHAAHASLTLHAGHASHASLTLHTGHASLAFHALLAFHAGHASHASLGSSGSGGGSSRGGGGSSRSGGGSGFLLATGGDGESDQGGDEEGLFHCVDSFIDKVRKIQKRDRERPNQQKIITSLGFSM